MNTGRLIVCAALVLFLSGFSPLAAEEAPGSQVFDLGQVVVVDQDNEYAGKITTTEVVTAEDIRLQGAQTAAEALDLIPGVDVQTGKKGESSLKLRGFEQRDIKFLIDGVPSGISYDRSLDLSQIPVDAISEIRVIKGAASVLYGPNAMGGVINIITKKGGKTPYTKLTASFGQNATRNYVVNHGASKGKFNYWITGSIRESDGFELSDRFDPNNPTTGTSSEYNEDGDTRDLSYYDKMSFNTKLGYEFDADSKLYLSFNYIDDEKGCPTEGGGRANYPRYWEYSEWKQWHVNLVGEHDLTDLLSVKARVYYQDYTNTIDDLNWDNLSGPNYRLGRWFDESVYDDYTVGGEIQGYLDFGDASLIRIGITYMKDNHKSQDYWDDTGYEDEEEYEADTYSFGIEDQIKFFEKLTFTAGVSYDVNDPVKAYDNSDRDKTDVWNPQAGIGYDISEVLSVYGSVGKKTRFPTLSELYSDLAGGNSELEAQETIAYEIGGKAKLGTMTTFSLAAFINDVENRIVKSDDGYENVGESDISGVEAQVRFMTPWNLDLGMAYTYMEGTDKDSADADETDAEYLPEHKLTADARYFFDFGLTATLQTIYTGEQIEYDSNDDKREIGNFILVNAKLNQRFDLTEKISTDLFLELKNIFDENYEEGSGPTPGRSFLAGISFTF
jgi:iron complex outermembrane receptor protein/outer membrane receptor for ferrienterochelin and colicins